MKIKFKKLQSEYNQELHYAKDGDAGIDLQAASHTWTVEKGHIYGTGIAVEIPEGYMGLIFPRSSNCKTDCYLANSVGVIDSGYRGEVKVIYKDKDFISPDGADNIRPPYQIGDKICQLIVMPYPHVEFEEAEELSSSDRGAGGFGSTGN